MKYWTIIAAILVTVSAGAVLAAEDSFDSEAADTVANHYIAGDENSVKPKGELTFTIGFTESASYDTLSISYTAKLTNSSGTTQSSAVSPSSGDLENRKTADLTVTAPSSTGEYTLTVTWTEKVTVDSKTTTYTYTDAQRVNVVTPITLSVTVSNDATVDIDTTVYFYVDGQKIEDSATALKVSAGGTSTITYAYYDSGLSHGKHTFYVANSDNSVKTDSTSFYYEDGNYDWMNYLMAIIFVIAIIAFIYVVRKPVKNYGKPKARR